LGAIEPNPPGVQRLYAAFRYEAAAST